LYDGILARIDKPEARVFYAVFLEALSKISAKLLCMAFGSFTINNNYLVTHANPEKQLSCFMVVDGNIALESSIKTYCFDISVFYHNNPEKQEYGCC